MSLSSIRKWILDKHPETKDKQKASFNNLTIKVHNLYGGFGRFMRDVEREEACFFCILAAPHVFGCRPVSISASVRFGTAVLPLCAFVLFQPLHIRIVSTFYPSGVDEARVGGGAGESQALVPPVA